MGLDVGERRVGVAVSDPERRFALPLRSVTRDGKGSEMNEIARIAGEDEITEVVVGLPLSLSGEAGEQAQASRVFAQELEGKLGLTVHLYDERLSTREANQRFGGVRPGGRRGRQPEPDIDAMAASIILQAFLDSRQVRRE
jgi:putative Holliday junction resolvase